MTKIYPLPTVNATWCNLSIKGEYYHRNEIRKAAFNSNSDSTHEYRFKVTLVCEPDNPYSTSGKAISVRNGSDILGYISSEEAEKYYPEIARVCASGAVAETVARLYVVGDLFSPDPGMHIHIALLEPGLNVPLNNPPTDGWALIPYGGAIQVTKEADHFDVLQDYVPASGKGMLLVTLHKANLGVKKTRVGVEVRLDGQRIGELTKASGEKILPAIEHLDAQGLDTVCYAKIQGSSVAAEVTLHLLRANEMDEDSLHPDAAPLPKLVEFELDPELYRVPNAYKGKPSPQPQEEDEDEYYGHDDTLDDDWSEDDDDEWSEDDHGDYSFDSDDYEREESLHEAVVTKPAVPVAAAASAAAVTTLGEVPWEVLLAPDNTPRATPLQRMYVRTTIGKKLPNKQAPRIDYATVGQCSALLEYFGEPVAPLTEAGRGSKATWWVLMILVFVFVLVMSTVPVIGQLIVITWIVFILHHFITRLMLKPPFGKQR